MLSDGGITPGALLTVSEHLFNAVLIPFPLSCECMSEAAALESGVHTFQKKRHTLLVILE